MKHPLQLIYHHYFPALKRFVAASFFLYTLFAFIAKGILQFLFNRILLFAGVTGLTKDNLAIIIKEPLALLCLFAFLILASGFLLIEFSVLTLAVTDLWHIDSLKILLKRLPSKLRQLFSWQAFIVLAYLILMIPLDNLGFSSALLEHLKIPNFINDELLKTSSGTLLLTSILLVTAYLNIRLISFLPLLGITDKTPKEALYASWQESKGSKLFKRLGLIILLTSLSFIIVTALLLGVTLLFAVIDSRGDNLPLATLFYSLVSLLVYIFILFVKFVFIIEATKHLTLPEALAQSTKKPTSRRYRIITSSFVMLVSIVWLVGNALSIYLVQDNSDEVLIAHRGDVTAGVENSIEALQAAHQKGADFSEMDVVMTKDNRFAVIHDNNLKRLAGIDKTVSQMTLKDLQKLTIHQGSFSSHIASLEEFLRAAERIGQPLMIELKPYGHEPDDYVERFLAVLESEKATHHKVMSLNKEVIEKVERLTPSISTGYLIPLQIGPLANYPVDFYAVEEFSFNPIFALSAEQQGKDTYVWTVNDDTLMTKILLSPTNGVITDELNLFNDKQKELKKDTTYFERALKLFESQD
ncbi:glycerophosphoryl diester phosphodiesterase membrane domain-containing protein [Streptococcus sp. zg-JUN1979]|uniref:glycerophosphoryl diester phosphodiesterase membrane domain-containing protein n=1 Tax=Streptococcus sp. zg-JUN1979 TaxID=3391450 RepID=UPI0039A762D6